MFLGALDARRPFLPLAIQFLFAVPPGLFAALEVAFLFLEPPTRRLGGFRLAAAFGFDLVAAAIPENAFLLQFLAAHLQLRLAGRDLPQPLVDDRRGLFSRGRLDGREGHGDFDIAHGDAVAVVEVSGADVAAVDGDGLDGGELAEAGAAGVAGDETDDGGDVAAGQAEVAAGDAADEEAAVADLVDGGPAAGPHFEADGGQGGRGQSLWHTENPRKGHP